MNNVIDSNALALLQQNFVKTKPYVDPSTIVEFRFGKKQNNEMVGILRTNDGKTFIKTISPNGTIETTFIELPIFATLQDRDRQIVAFYKRGYTQVDISMFMGLSQPQISRILATYKE